MPSKALGGRTVIPEARLPSISNHERTAALDDHTAMSIRATEGRLISALGPGNEGAQLP